MYQEKFIYSEKATKFCEIFTLLLSDVVPFKSKVKISQNFVAFSEYMNFNNFRKDISILFQCALLVFFSPKSTVAVLVYYTITHSFRYGGVTTAQARPATAAKPRPTTAAKPRRAPESRAHSPESRCNAGEPQLTANCCAGSGSEPVERKGRWWVAAAAAPGIRNKKECYSLLTCFW